MTMLMRLPPLTIALTLLLSACSNEARQTGRASAACDVALEYAKQSKLEAGKLGRPIAVNPDYVFFIPARREIEQMLADNPELKADADADLILAAADLRERRVIDECSNLRSWLQTSDIVHDKGGIGEFTRHKEWPVVILSMSFPAVSEDGSTALFFVSETAGPLAGSSISVSYKRTANGQWMLHKKETLAVS